MKKVKFRVLGEAIDIHAVIEKQKTLFPKMVRKVPTLGEIKKSGYFNKGSKCSK